MPYFKNREEYEKWKAKKIEDQRNKEEIKHKENTINVNDKLEKDKGELSWVVRNRIEWNKVKDEIKEGWGDLKIKTSAEDKVKNEKKESWQEDLVLSIIAGCISIYQFYTGHKWWGVSFTIIFIWKFIKFIKKVGKPLKEDLTSLPQYDNVNFSDANQETETVKCPFCQEIIKATAIKCKHCGSMLTPFQKKSVSTKDEKNKDIFSIAAIVSGGLSVILPVVVSWLTAVTGIIMGTIALVRKENRSLAYIGIFLSIGAILFVLKACSDISEELSRLPGF